LLERIDAWARRRPDRLAFRSTAGQLTYAELIQRSAATAAFIWHELHHDGSPVVVYGHKEPEMLVAFLGSAQAGHPYVPLDCSLPRHRVEQVIATCGARLILTVADIRHAVGLKLVSAPPDARVQSDDPFYVMFTSGSTGEPKGVTITLRNLTSFLEWMRAEQAFRRGAEVFLNQAPFSFDLSVMDTYLSLSAGGTLVSVSAREIETPRVLYEFLQSAQLTTWVSTPSFARLCVAERAFGAGMLPSLRRFLFCGETLPHDLAARLLDRFPSAEVWNTYGPTEATVATTSVRIDRALLSRYAILPVGIPRPGSRIVLAGVEGEHAGLDAGRGEIVIAGANVSPGYLHQPELTTRRFFDLDGMRAYRTGDLGHFHDGLLFFDGRLDDQIKLNGYRIEIGDVESNLRSLAGVRDAIVLPLNRADRVEALAAFVLIETHGSETDFQVGVRVRSALAERLPAYMLPRFVQPVQAWPLTPNGKVDRRALAGRLA
jgi:D-alanine--poly(phosphoribitol) ligase subunit 1